MGPPNKPYEGWPKVVKDLSPQPTTRYEKFLITAAPAKDQSEGGTGGAILDITVKDTNSGKSLVLETSSVGVRILEKYNGFPQIEVWGRGGGGTCSRRLYRVEHEKYIPIRADQFDVRIENAKRKDVIAQSPGEDGYGGYYTGTMYPQKADLEDDQ